MGVNGYPYPPDREHRAALSTATTMHVYMASPGERKFVEELRMHLAWRWFTGLGFDQEIPHHSTFSKNRHGRFQESKLFEQLFEEIVRQCVEVGLVQGEHLSVDGSFVEANAAKGSRIPREQLVEAAPVNHTVRQYWWNWKRRTRWRNQCMSKTRFQPPIRIRPMPRRVVRQLGWGTTTTI